MSLQPCRPPPELVVVNETAAHGPAIEALLDRAFGPGRFAKVSERVREWSFVSDCGAGSPMVAP